MENGIYHFHKTGFIFLHEYQNNISIFHKIDFVTKKGSKKHHFFRGGVKTRGGVQKVQKIPPKKHQFLTLSGPWTSGGGLDPPRRPPKKGGNNPENRGPFGPGGAPGGGIWVPGGGWGGRGGYPQGRGGYNRVTPFSGGGEDFL